MRSAVNKRKDFVEIFFISTLFLALAIFSSCASMPVEASSPAPARYETPTSPSQLVLLKGGRAVRE